MTDDLSGDLLEEYYDLHDLLSDMIESGKLTCVKERYPDQYRKLVACLVSCVAVAYQP